MMKRKIFAQGDLDGACYLYSIANSYSALTTKQITSTQWKRAVNAIPFRADEFLSGDGTKSLGNTPEYFEGLCRNFLEKIGNTCFQVIRNEAISSKSLRNVLTDSQVAIVAIDDGDHWVSIVDEDKGQFYLACSAAALNSGSETYAEQKSPNFNRDYNITSSFRNLKIWHKYAMLIRIVSSEA